MQKHFVIFFSSCTFITEQTQKPIDNWDKEKAVEMSRRITERYGAKPYGFCFTTRERKFTELDSREIKRSNMYYLGGDVLTLKELKAKNDPRNQILISNMECNGHNSIVVNNNSWQWIQPLNDDDEVLNY